MLASSQEQPLEPANTQSIELQDGALRAFESAVCDHDRMGTWVYLDKIIPKEDENAANPAGKKPAPAKGKPAAAVDELKPQHAKAWLNLVPLMQPGAKSLTQRCMLMPVPPNEVKESMSPSQAATPMTPGQQQQEPSNEEPEDIYSPCQTYIYLTINLDEPLYPEPSAIKTDSADLLPKFKEPKKYPGTKDAIATYESAIKYIVS